MKNNKIYIFFIIVFFINIFIFIPFNYVYSVPGNPFVSQEELDANKNDAKNNLKSAFGSKLSTAIQSAGYGADKSEIEPMIGTVIQAALSFLGVIFVILMIYGGFLWMTAKGNEQQVEKAKELLMAAAIGLAIVTAAYAISYFVIKSFSEGALLEAQTQ